MFSEAQLFRALGDIFSDPRIVRVVVWVYIVMYYAISYAYLWAERNRKSLAVLKRNGAVDKATSALWIVVGVLLISSLLTIACEQRLTLGILAEYYVAFIFLFAFLYGIIEWHWPGKLEGVKPDSYESEWQYLFMSVGAQTTMGFTRVRPNHWVTEMIAAFQAVLGVAFVGGWVALAIGRIEK
jgi:hypothetical protein